MAKTNGQAKSGRPNNLQIWENHQRLYRSMPWKVLWRKTNTKTNQTCLLQAKINGTKSMSQTILAPSWPLSAEISRVTYALTAFNQQSRKKSSTNKISSIIKQNSRYFAKNRQYWVFVRSYRHGTVLVIVYILNPNLGNHNEHFVRATPQTNFSNTSHGIQGEKLKMNQTGCLTEATDSEQLNPPVVSENNFWVFRIFAFRRVKIETFCISAVKVSSNFEKQFKNFPQLYYVPPISMKTRK